MLSLPASWPFLVSVVSGMMVEVLPSGRTVPVLLALSHTSEVWYQNIYFLYIYLRIYIYNFLFACFLFLANPLDLLPGRS